MKKGIIVLIIFLELISVPALGADGFQVEDFDLTDSFHSLQEHDLKKETGEEILQLMQQGKIESVVHQLGELIIEKTLGDLTALKKIFLNFIALVLISGFFTSFARVFPKSSVNDTAFYICYLSMVAMIISLFEVVMKWGSGFLEFVVSFMSATIPTYFIAVSVLGQASAGGFYRLIVISIGLVQYLFLKFLLPLLKIYLTLGLVNNISKEDFLSKLCELLRFVFQKGVKYFVGAVVGMNLLQALLLPNIDATKNSFALKMAQSIPGIGTSIGGYSGVIIGSLHLIKNTIGGYAIVLLLFICLVPYIKIQCYHLSIRILLAMSQPVADQRIGSGLQIVAESIEMLAGLVLSVGIMWIVCIAIICISTNFIR